MKVTFIVFIFTILGCQSLILPTGVDSEIREPASKIDEARYFKSVSQEERMTIIKNAKTFFIQNHEISKLKIQDFLAEKCGAHYKYEFDTQTGEYTWPTVSCHYKPDQDMTGMSAKFKCEFMNAQGELKTHKIKYSKSSINPKNSEVLEVFLGSTLAHLMGFASAVYCPVQLVCKDCPSADPWGSSRSSASAQIGSLYKFNYALVEHKLSGFEVTSHAPNPKPQGLAWEELKNVSGNAMQEKAELIDREVWMMFIHFLRHYDADPHNQKIVCSQAVEIEKNNGADKQFSCQQSYVFTGDYGLSYPRGHIFIWDEPIAKQNGQLCIGTLNKAWIGGAPGTGLILGTSFSEEARIKFLSLIEQITENQWRELYGIAQYGTLTELTIDNWIETTKRKISKLRKLKCPYFESGLSSLGKN